MSNQRFSRHSSITGSSITPYKPCNSVWQSSIYPSLSNFKHLDNKFPEVIRCNIYARRDSQTTNSYMSIDPPPYDEVNSCNTSTKVLDQIDPLSIPDNRPLGLPNSKSYCYMNSVIQSLSHCIEFSNAVLSYQLDTDDSKMQCRKADSVLVSLFFQLMHDIGYRNKDTIEASSIAFQNIHDGFPEFADGEQDADEYLQFLLNKLNDVTKLIPKKIRKKDNENKEESFKRFIEDNNSFATRLFCGQMNNELHCFHCQYCKPSFQVFWVLPMPITMSNEEDTEISLESCLESMLTKEKIDGKTCSKCHSENSIFTKTEITHWPIYFIIHLKRHIQSGHSYKARTKINWKINETLNARLNTKYSLLGVIDHIGSTRSGHYMAKFRDLNYHDLWWRLNDTLVSKIEKPEEEVITSNTTTYFFAKLNTVR